MGYPGLPVFIFLQNNVQMVQPSPEICLIPNKISAYSAKASYIVSNSFSDCFFFAWKTSNKSDLTPIDTL